MKVYQQVREFPTITRHVVECEKCVSHVGISHLMADLFMSRANLFLLGEINDCSIRTYNGLMTRMARTLREVTEIIEMIEH